MNRIGTNELENALTFRLFMKIHVYNIKPGVNAIKTNVGPDQLAS